MKRFWNKQNTLCLNCIDKLSLKLEYQVINDNSLHITLKGNETLFNEYEKYNSKDHYIIDYLEQYVFNHVLPKLNFKYIGTLVYFDDLVNGDCLNFIFKDTDNNKLNIAISVFS